MRNLGVVIAAILLLGATDAQAQQSEPEKPKGTISGQLFGVVWSRFR